MAWVMAAMWVVVEGGGEGAAAMAGGAEGDALRGDGGVGTERVVGGDEAGDVDEGGRERRLAGSVLFWRAHAGGVLLGLISFGVRSIWDAVVACDEDCMDLAGAGNDTAVGGKVLVF